MDDFMTKPIVEKELTIMFSKWLGIVEVKVLKPNGDKIQHLNKEWLNEYISGDSEFKINFLELIKVGLNESVISLKKEVRRKDLTAIKASGHKLKGTSLTAGFTELSKLAMAFELLENFDEEYINDLMENTIAEIEVVLELLGNE
jgi:HPt (histidine-containing phosphotransfer) domain-containing protein